MTDAKILVDGNRIQEITPDGIVYLDDAGEKQFIDFALCHQNYFELRTRPESLQKWKEWNHKTDDDLSEHIRRIREDTVVAGRVFDGGLDAKYPYIEFYSEPRIRFEFQTKDEFYRVRHTIHKSKKWRTEDWA